MKKRTIIYSTAAISAAIVIGCAGSSSGSNSGVNGLLFAPSASPITHDNDTGVHNWISLNEGGTVSHIWGSTTDTGLPAVPIEVSAGNSATSVEGRIFYTPDGQPSLLSNSTGTAVVSLNWLPDRLLARFYDGVGLFAGAVNVVQSGSNLVVSAETGAPASMAGTYSVSLNGLDAGILSFTLQADDGSSAGCGQGSLPASVGQAAQGDTRKEWLAKLDSDALADRLSALQSAFFDQAASQHSGGSNAMLKEMVEKAMPKGNRTTFMNAVGGWARVLHATDALLEKVHKLNTEWDTYSDNERNQVFPMSANAFAEAGYVPSNEFPSLREKGDPTTVTGVAFSRNFDIVSLKGTVDSEGKFKLQGTTPEKGEFIVDGSITPGDGTAAVNWHWPWEDADGDGSGDRDETGTCNASQASGGQGGTIGVHNVGSACGELTFSYEMYSIPDAVKVIQGDSVLFDTGGLVSGGQTVTLKLRPTEGKIVRIIVTAPNDGTAWDYTLGCPSSGNAKPLVKRVNPEKL